MSPTPFVCANWKMHRRASEVDDWSARFAAALAAGERPVEDQVEIAIAPAAPLLDRLGGALEGTGVALAAQHVHQEAEGAFTGEVAVDMLTDLSCRYALVGHSERRQIFGETDALVAAKVARLADSPVRPIVCVGETLDEREADQTLEVVGRQLAAALDTGSPLGDALVVAYEPVWAIGTGRTATPEIAQEVHAALRDQLVGALGAAGRGVRILYGGSVKPSNARALLSQPDLDGALVGGASLDPDDFAAIVFAALG